MRLNKFATFLSSEECAICGYHIPLSPFVPSDILACPRCGIRVIGDHPHFNGIQSLRHLLLDSNPLAFDRVAQLSANVATFLIRAHQVGKIHAHLSPSCVLVGNSNECAIRANIIPCPIQESLTWHIMNADYNLSRDPTLIDYSAPEQFQAIPRLDFRVDVYATGAILFYLLCGLSPLAQCQSITEKIVAKLKGEVPCPSAFRNDIPAYLEHVCMRALETNPQRRYENLQRFVEELKLALL